MSLQLLDYPDLDKKTMEITPIVVNRYGQIGLHIRFRCGFDVRRMLIAIYTYPNGAAPCRFDTIGEAFTHLKRNGVEAPYKDCVFDEGIEPVVGVDKAVLLKPYYHPDWKKNRNPKFIYKNAITVPDGSIDFIGRYDGKKITFTFNVKSSKRAKSGIFKNLEDAFAWLVAIAGFKDVHPSHAPKIYADAISNS